jgi:serine/threonine protein kinase/Tfp pilus assembly protein PilF
MIHPEVQTAALSSAPVDVQLASCDPGRELVSEVIALWAQGASPDARAVLARHPELNANKSLVLDLAYEEYCCRKEAGAPPDPDEFCARFPSFQASLRRLIRAHQFLEQSSPLPDDNAPTRRPQPGDSVLGFSLVRELGRGSFAQVFLAREPALGNRRVAVKIALRGAAEAQTLGRLTHPNVVPVFSVREDPLTGLTAVCMPYAGSATLCDVLDRAFRETALPTRACVILESAGEGVVKEAGFDDGLPPDAVLGTGTYVDGVVRLGAQLADALAFTHSQGIYHRDLKPSNVLLTPAGKPMLLDFNLSSDGRVAEERLGGTLPYMAPEHLRATDVERGIDPSLVDARSDVFSLGVILYELLTGVNPFGRIPANASSAKVRAHLLERQQAGPNPLRRANPGVDGSLARVIQRCLAFDPKDRPASADALATALRVNLAGWKGGRWVVVHRRAVLRAGVAALVLAGAAGYLLSQVDPPNVRCLRAGLEAYRNQDYPAAVEKFSRAAEMVPSNPWVWFARGRCYQQQATVEWVRGEKSAPLFHKALEDYEQASKLTTDGRILVCMGICNSLVPNHPKAVQRYQQAIDVGFKSAEVFNNQGHSYLQLSKFNEARNCLKEAIKLNPQLTAAYHNRAWIGLRESDPDVGCMITDIEKAIALSCLNAETAQLYGDAACMCALAGQLDKASTLESQAVQYGQDGVALRAALNHFSKGKIEARPSSGPARKALQTLRVVDPIPGIPADLLFGD